MVATIVKRTKICLAILSFFICALIFGFLHNFSASTITDPLKLLATNNNDGVFASSRKEHLAYHESCSNIPKNLLNLTNFQYRAACEQLCLTHKPSIIIIVHSAIANYVNRDVIRNTWGSVKKYRGWNLELVFLLGVDMNTNVFLGNQPIDANDHNHHDHYCSDLVIGNFHDSYRNLTYKHLMGYKWVAEHCPSAEYIIKVDDDVFLNIFYLLKLIEENETKKNTTDRVHIIGNLMSGYSPERKGSKADVTFDEFRGEIYPDYVSGLIYVIHANEACQIFKLHTSKPFLWVDDVFVTGVLRDPLKLRIQEVNSQYFLPGAEVNPTLLKWYANSTNESPPPWAFILDSTALGNSMWEKFGTLWTRTMRSYQIRPGYGFNEFT